MLESPPPPFFCSGLPQHHSLHPIVKHLPCENPVYATTGVIGVYEAGSSDLLSLCPSLCPSAPPHPPPCFVFMFCFLSLVLIRQVGHVKGYLFTVYGKLTMLFWRKKKKVSVIFFPARLIVTAGAYEMGSSELLEEKKVSVSPPPPPPRGGGGRGHSNNFLTGVCLTKPWNGGLKELTTIKQKIGSLELQKPWNGSLGGPTSWLE